MNNDDRDDINTAISTNLGSASYHAEADLNLDGTISSADITEWNGANGASIDAGSISGQGNIVGYAGYLFEEATGMYLARHRWYSPEHGRWINRDPIEYVAGDSNMYGYVGQRPAQYVDPFGLYEEIDEFLDGIDYTKPGHAKFQGSHKVSKELVDDVLDTACYTKCMAILLPGDVAETVTNYLIDTIGTAKELGPLGGLPSPVKLDNLDFDSVNSASDLWGQVIDTSWKSPLDDPLAYVQWLTRAGEFGLRRRQQILLARLSLQFELPYGNGVKSWIGTRELVLGNEGQTLKLKAMGNPKLIGRLSAIGKLAGRASGIIAVGQLLYEGYGEIKRSHKHCKAKCAEKRCE